MNENPMNWKPPSLQTERLCLRAIQITDAPAMFEYASNENVARFVLWNAQKTLQDAVSFIEGYAFKNYQSQEPEPFAITLKSDPSKMIGSIGFWWSSKKFQCVEMGFALSEKYWNQGILTEAAQEVIRYAFNEYSEQVSPVNRIQADCKLENTASARVMEKMGMKFEAIHRERVFSKNRFWDMKVYAVLRRDWLR
jgi:ribosomal-protein-alanine N-acetyltransferase